MVGKSSRKTSEDEKRQALRTIERWLEPREDFQASYSDFFRKWALLNLFYNALYKFEGDKRKVLAFATYYGYEFGEVRNEARELVSHECVGRGSEDEQPDEQVLDATLYLRNFFDIDSKPICSKCGKKDGCEKKPSPGYKEFNKEIKIDEFSALIRIVYQIRCNLFHGDKFGYSKRDKELVELGDKVLTNILSGLVSRERVKVGD